MEKVSSLYIHFPYCKNCCNYCDFHKKRIVNGAEVQDYQQLLGNQHREALKLMDSEGFEFAPLETLYLGGGTPSLWSFQGIEYLNSFLRMFRLSERLEFTLEVNPAEISKDELLKWTEVGVNRISMGIQALSDPHLKLLDRTHSLREAYQAMELLASTGINYSVDLLLGIPGSESRNVKKELESLLQFKPDHISLYILTTKENYSLIDALPSEEQVATEYLDCADYLCGKGFTHYEVSNFAYPGKEATHNLRYWKSQSVAALGPSATGLLVREGKGLRYKWNWQNQPMLERLNLEELELERQYMRLRTNLGTTLEVPEKLVLRWYQQGYLMGPQQPIRLTSKGYLLLDSLMDDLFYYASR